MSPRWSALPLALLCAVAGCRKSAPAHEAAPDAGVAHAAVDAGPTQDSRVGIRARTEKAAPLEPCEAPGDGALEAARLHFDRGHYAQALSCAAEASARFPDDPSAHTERAVALAALDRFDEARLAYARALALNPDDLDALSNAARLYVVLLPGSREHDDLGVLYAERGLALAKARADPVFTRELGIVAAMAWNDLGQSTRALDRASAVLATNPDDADAKYERALALFELCRFPEAKQAFLALRNDPSHSAHAEQHLGLLLEREGQGAEAEAHFQKARELRPDDFLPPVAISREAFARELAAEVAALPAEMRKDLGDIPVTPEELPSTEDLTGNDPPLSPSIVGLFRGPPLGEPCDPPTHPNEPCRSVVLYRSNLARTTESLDEFKQELRTTLLHEVGHLRGEDDDELAARGLE